jgi:hypothetical protein
MIQSRPIIGLRITDDDRPVYYLLIRKEEVVPGAEPRVLNNEPILELDEWGAKHLHLQLSNALGFRGGMTPEQIQELDDTLPEGKGEIIQWLQDHYHLMTRETSRSTTSPCRNGCRWTVALSMSPATARVYLTDWR